MACHYLVLQDHKEFLTKMKNRDQELVLKMVKCVLSAFKRKKDNIDVFEITFKNKEQMLFSIQSSQYVSCLRSCIDDLISMDTTESYMLCAEIRDLEVKPKRLSYKKNLES